VRVDWQDVSPLAVGDAARQVAEAEGHAVTFSSRWAIPGRHLHDYFRCKKKKKLLLVGVSCFVVGGKHEKRIKKKRGKTCQMMNKLKERNSKLENVRNETYCATCTRKFSR
jgi:hypothetical protein